MAATYAKFPSSEPCPCQLARLIVFDWYDGPLSGLAECDDHVTSYCFQCVACDTAQDNRVYTLAPLRSGDFTEIVLQLEYYLAPKWPVWVPPWTFPSADQLSRINTIVDCVNSNAKPLEWLVLSSDLISGFDRCLRINEPIREQVESLIASRKPFDFWLDYLASGRDLSP